MDTASVSTSSALLDLIGPQLDELTAHPWVRGFAAGTLTDAQWRAWAAEDTHFCEAERRALLTLQSYGASPSLTGIFGELLADCQREPGELFSGILRELGVTPTAHPSIVTAGYGAWLRLQAHEGLLPGTVAVWTAEESYRRIFTAAHAASEPGTRQHQLSGNWVNPRFTEICGGLGDSLTSLAWRGSAVSLGPVVIQGVAFEQAFLDMCWESGRGSGRRRGLGPLPRPGETP